MGGCTQQYYKVTQQRTGWRSGAGGGPVIRQALVIVGRAPELAEDHTAGLAELLGRRQDAAMLLGLQAEIIGDGRHTDHGDGGAEGRLLRRDLVVRHGCSSSRPGGCWHLSQIWARRIYTIFYIECKFLILCYHDSHGS